MGSGGAPEKRTMGEVLKTHQSATVPAAGVYPPSASDDIDITGKTSRAYAGGGAASSFMPPGEKSRVDQLLQRLQQGISVA
eukprot:s1901_g6.t1